MRFAIFLEWKSTRRPCCHPTNRPTDSTPTPTRSRCSPRSWTAISPRPRRSRGSPSAIRRFLPGFERYTALKDNSNETTWLWQNERLGEEFPLGSRGGIVARHYFPVDGEYVFKIRLDRTDTGLIRGLQARSDIDIRVDGARVGQLTIGGTPEFTGANANANGNPRLRGVQQPADERR